MRQRLSWRQTAFLLDFFFFLAALLGGLAAAIGPIVLALGLFATGLSSILGLFSPLAMGAGSVAGIPVSVIVVALFCGLIHVFLTRTTAGRDAGADYSRWRDVALTLQGRYGARTTMTVPDRPESERASMYYWFWWPEYNNPSDYLFPILSQDATPKAALFNSGYYTNTTVNEMMVAGFVRVRPRIER